MRNWKKTKTAGFLTLFAIVLIVIFALMGLVATYLTNTSQLSRTNELTSQQALYIAESGMEIAVQVYNGGVACNTLASTASLQNQSLNGGVYNISASASTVAASTLSLAITTSATTIPLTNASGFAARGLVTIDQESIGYDGIASNALQNVQRGIGNTVIVAHNSGAAVSQNQCAITSQGGVPSLNPAGGTIGGMRTVWQALSLGQTTWAVGTTGTNAQFVKGVGNSWGSTSGTAGVTLNSVYMVSATDAWAVGTGGNIYHWTGGVWSAVTSNTTRNLLAVYCTSSNNCWAVGANKTFDLWNGSTWTVQTISVAALPSVQYNSVFCVSSSNCVAAGNLNLGSMTIARWNGLVWTSDVILGSPAANFKGIACSSATNCWAVGDRQKFAQFNGLIWSYNSQSVPNVNYNGITCLPGVNDCWAVGQNGTIIHWTGGSWATVTSNTTNTLQEVDCATSSSCWAVGANGTIDYWNGSTWTASRPVTGTLYGVSGFNAASSSIVYWLELFP